MNREIVLQLPLLVGASARAVPARAAKCDEFLTFTAAILLLRYARPVLYEP